MHLMRVYKENYYSLKESHILLMIIMIHSNWTSKYQVKHEELGEAFFSFLKIKLFPLMLENWYRKAEWRKNGLKKIWQQFVFLSDN